MVFLDGEDFFDLQEQLLNLDNATAGPHACIPEEGRGICVMCHFKRSRVEYGRLVLGGLSLESFEQRLDRVDDHCSRLEVDKDRDIVTDYHDDFAQ